jgi:hypothetical protein
MSICINIKLLRGGNLWRSSGQFNIRLSDVAPMQRNTEYNQVLAKVAAPNLP